MLYPLSYGANADKDSGPGAAAARRQGSSSFRSLSRPLAAVSKGRWMRPRYLLGIPDGRGSGHQARHDLLPLS